MDEMRSEDIDELVKELKEEHGAQETLPQEVEELLHILESGSAPLDRQEAAEQLGRVVTSSPRIVHGLIGACQSDFSPKVRRAAAKSLQAPVHQEYLRQYPDLMETTERALEQRPGAEGRWLSGEESEYRTSDEPESLSYRFGTALGALFVRIWPSRTRRPNWITSGEEAQYRTSDQPLSYYTGAVLGAMYVRIKRSLTKRPASVSPGEPGAVGAQAPGKPSLVYEGDRASDCPACGAWNPPGSEHCGECGAALESADA